MASRPTRGRPSGARSPHRRPRSEAEALVTGVFGQWLAVRSVSRPCQCFHIALAAAPAGLTVRLAMSPPVSPPNERSEGGAGAFRGTPLPLGSLTSFAHIALAAAVARGGLAAV